MRSREKEKGTEKKMHHLHVQRITAGVKLTFCALDSVMPSTAPYYTAHHSLTLSYALDTLTILHHTAFQGGSRFRSCACACFCVVCLRI